MTGWTRNYAILLRLLMLFGVLFLVGCPSPTGGGGDGSPAAPGDPGGPAGPIDFNPSTAQGIQVSQTLAITAIVEGGQTVTWSVDSDGVVTLNPNGNSVEITGVAIGQTNIVATLPDTQSASLSVTVYEPGINLVTPAASVRHTETVDISGFAELTPAEFVTQSFSFSSNNGAIASVNAAGVVTGEAPGSTTVTITSAVDPADNVDVDITVDPFPVDVVIRRDGTPISELALLVGQSAVDLEATVSPDLSPSGVTWSLDGAAGIATITPTGSVSPSGPGTTQIVATSDYNPARQTVIPLEVGTPGSLTLNVVDGIGGPFLDGADVTLVGPSNLSDTTDADGTVIFPTVLPGSYTIDVTDVGYATSRIRDFTMTLDDQTIELPVYRAATDFRSLTPPAISVDGIVPGGTYTSPRSVTATAVGDNPIAGNSDRFGLAVGVDGPADSANAVAVSGNGSLAFTFDSEDLPDGPVTVTFVAYDNNNNRTQYSFDVNTAGGNGSAPFQSVFNFDVNFVEATTWGVQQPFYSTSEMHPLAAGADSTIQVRISVDRLATTISGLRVYRSNTASGPFIPIGRTTTIINVDDDGDPATPGTKEVFFFSDTSSILTPGEDYFYRFAYFNGAGEGPSTGSTHGVTILPAYRLNLTTPADQAGNVANPVTLQWDVTVDGTMPAGAQREDGVYLVDPTFAQLLYLNIVTDVTVDTLPASLAPGAVYEWNVFSSWTLAGTGRGSSVAFPSNFGGLPYLPGVSSFANNGGFQFTVQ